MQHRAAATVSAADKGSNGCDMPVDGQRHDQAITIVGVVLVKVLMRRMLRIHAVLEHTS